MLVLSRRTPEYVMVGDRKVVVARVDATGVTLALSAAEPFILYRPVESGLVPFEPEPRSAWELTLKRDQAVAFDEQTAIACLDIRGDKVRLGFTYPQECPVHRGEVYEAILREKQRSQ